MDVARAESYQAVCELLEQRGAKSNTELTEVAINLWAAMLLMFCASLAPSLPYIAQEKRGSLVHKV